VKLAYADPPYLGFCQKYGHEHNDSGGRAFDSLCWDDPQTHKLLFDYLAAHYDGWAYSLTSTTLAQLLPMVPHARVAAWVKPFASFKRGVRIAYAWEPVLFVPARRAQQEGVPYGRDFIAESITLRRGFTGTKPERVCRWVLDLLGYVDGDEVTDLFVGTGPMQRALAQAPLDLYSATAEEAI